MRRYYRKKCKFAATQIERYMKKFLTLGFFALVLMLNGCKDRAVTPDQIPESIMSFIQQSFPGKHVTYAENERKLTGTTYEIVLTDGTRIDFDTSGEWEKMEGTVNNPLPTPLIPVPITNYIKANYPDAMILMIDKEDHGYDVELANGLELRFNKQGEFIGMDD